MLILRNCVKNFLAGITAALSIVVCFNGCSPSGKSEISRDINVFGEDDEAAVLAVIKAAPTGKAMPMDFSNDHHYRFWKKQLYMAGANEDTHPQLFAQLDKTREEHVKKSKTQALLTQGPVGLSSGISEITSFVGTPGTQQYSTSGLLSYPYGSINTATISIALYNQAGHIVGTPNRASGYAPNQLTRLSVNSQGTATGADSVYSMYAYMYQDNIGVHHNIIKALTTNVVDSIVNIAPMTCVLNQPVTSCTSCCANPGTCVPASPPAPCPILCTNSNIITVCMTRTTSNCTYCNPGLVSSLMFPMQGHVVYTGNINVDGQGKPNDGAFGTVTLTRLPSGGGCPAIPLQGDFLNYVTVTGNKLSWNIPPAVFPNTCLATGDSVLFQLTIFVMVGQDPAFATISNAPNIDPPALRIPRILILAGCLAEGTLITMADGKTIPIEKVAMLSKVKTPDNKELLVDYNTTGVEEKPSLRIKTDKKQSLLVTDAHPIITKDGVRMAKELKVGDKLETEQGMATITSITPEQYNGTVWNLAVSPPGEEKDYKGEATTFYANGILVGDHKMQNYTKYKVWSREDVLKNLDKSWHQDYLNSLNSKKN